MKEVTVRLLRKAARSISAAERLLQSGDVDFAASRAYYAMFYVTEGLLAERGLRFRKHGGVHAAFGQSFAQSGELDSKYHRWLLAAFNKRIAGDYDVGAEVTATEVRTMIDQALEFLEEGKLYLKAPAN